MSKKKASVIRLDDVLQKGEVLSYLARFGITCPVVIFDHTGVDRFAQASAMAACLGNSESISKILGRS